MSVLLSYGMLLYSILTCTLILYRVQELVTPVDVCNLIFRDIWYQETHYLTFSLALREHLRTHYDNMPMQYTKNFNGCKNDIFQLKV